MADYRQLEIIHQGVETWNQWRRENPGAEIDLMQSTFTETVRLPQDLKGINLSDASMQALWLHDTNFENADLARARIGAVLLFIGLCEAKLTGANFRNANLEGADLRRADFERTVLEGANLKGADLRGCINLTCEQLQTSKNWWDALRDPELLCGRPLPEVQIKEMIAAGLAQSRNTLDALDEANSELRRSAKGNADATVSQRRDSEPRIGHNKPPTPIFEDIDEGALPEVAEPVIRWRLRRW